MVTPNPSGQSTIEPSEIKPEESKKKISIMISRRDGKTYFKFEIDPRIEQMYSEMAKEKKSSSSWAGLEFYYLPLILGDNKYQQALKQSKLMDDFGHSLFSQGMFNIAWLRTVGGKGEILLKYNETLSYSDIALQIESASRFIKQYFEEYYRGFKISSIISVEL